MKARAAKSAPTGAIPITTPLNISALAREHGVSRKTILRRLAKGWRPEVHTPPVHTPHTPVRKEPAKAKFVPTVQVRTPVGEQVSIAELHDEIWDWVAQYHRVSKLKARARAGRGVRGETAVRMTFLVLAVGFYALIACAAVRL